MKYSTLPAGVRLAAALFMLSMIYFYAHAQWNLWTNVGKESLPTVNDVLVEYHGTRERSRLEAVLDPERDPKDNLAMYAYLDGDYQGPEVQQERHGRILAWLRGGATEEGWESVKDIFRNDKLCTSCHVPGGEMARAPLTTFAEVKRYTVVDEGPSVSHLSKLSHSHLAGFSLIALATSLLFACTRYRMIVMAPLCVAAFLGPMLDVSGWWLTKAHGMPWPYLVIAGGAMFGLAVMTMVALTLDELLLRGLVGRTLEAGTRLVGLRLRHDPPPPRNAT